MGFEYWNMEPFIHEGKKSKNDIKMLTNSYLDKYIILWGKKINLYKKNFLEAYCDINLLPINEQTKKLFLTKNKIIVRGVSQKLTAVLDEEGSGLLVAVHSIITNKYNPKLILGLLNSNFLNWIHKDKFYLGRIPEGSLKYPVSFLKELPFPIEINSDYEGRIIFLVDGITELKNKINLLKDKNTDEKMKLEAQIKKLDDEINELVYKIYGITEEEKKIIEGELK
jgi:hypothetical protein